MPDLTTLIAFGAVFIAAFGAGRYVERFNSPAATKARAFSKAMAALKQIEAMKPDSVSLAAEVAREAAQVQAIKDETAKLA